MKLADFKTMPREGFPTTNQWVLDFGKYHLSVITGGYGRAEAPYEIAVFAANDGVSQGFVQLPGITGPDDDVRGYMTQEDVDAVLVKLYVITGEEPVQI
jgi:hypothetical protein